MSKRATTQNEHRVMVRFYPDQYNRLCELAAEEGLAISTYIRRATVVFMNKNHDLMERLK